MREPLLIGILVVLSWTCANAKEKYVVCYYGTWATYRSGDGKFDVSNIDGSLCTHLIYTFVGIDNTGAVKSLDPYLDLPDNWGKDNFRQFNNLKNSFPHIKTLLAVGGWNEGSAKYSNMVSNAASRKIFIDSAIIMMLQYGFDGFDLDWEYPNRRDSTHGRDDIDNFSQLLKEMRDALDMHGLLLTAAVSSVRASASLSYDIPLVCRYVDFINLMTYDMHGPWDPVTGHNAPLHRGEGDEQVLREDAYTVDVAVEYWLQQGCPSEKVVLGLPLYGRTFTLSNENEFGVRAPVSGAGLAGPWTQTNGLIGYNEFCSRLKAEPWNMLYDQKAKVPFAVQRGNWVSYDDANSLANKTQYALEKELGGVMVWSIETDDFHGLCENEPFLLMKAINKALQRDLPEEISTVSAASSTTPSTTTVTPSTNFPISTGSPNVPTHSPSLCHEEGFASDPENCSIFYRCTYASDGTLVAIKFQCPNDLLWDLSVAACNYPDLVDCNHN